MTPPAGFPADYLDQRLREWLKKEGNARSTLAGAIVVLDKLATVCPLTDSDVFTQGGQLVGGRGASLFGILGKYEISPDFLRDGVTTRSTEKFRRLLQALEYGKPFVNLEAEKRLEILNRLVAIINEKIFEWFSRQHIKVICDRRLSPLAWVEEILQAAKGRSEGRVEQHLVGAKLESRLPNACIGRNAATAGDVQTGRVGDFRTTRSVYHVTAAPSSGVITKCRENVQEGLHPVLLVPRVAVERAKGLAQDQSMEQQMSIFSIEDFVAHNIVELTEDQGAELIDTLRKMIDAYNSRIEEAEIDKSLRIEIR